MSSSGDTVSLAGTAEALVVQTLAASDLPALLRRHVLKPAGITDSMLEHPSIGVLVAIASQMQKLVLRKG